MPDTTPEELHAAIAARYDVTTQVVPIGAALFRLLAVRDTNRLLDSITPDAFAADERLPYWAELWASSLDLAALLMERTDLAGTSVLELGCGLGLGGIAAAARGARVRMTDYEPDALLFARYNALLNLTPGAAAGVEFTMMDWRSPGKLPCYDIVLGADIVYDRKNFIPVLNLLRSCLSPAGFAIFTDPDRSIGRDFLDGARKQQFGIEQTISTVMHHGKNLRITRNILRTPPGGTTP